MGGAFCAFYPAVPGACCLFRYARVGGPFAGGQAASLAGLAPVSQSSGKWQGKERIQGGRAQLRKALYMPALVATRVNPDMPRKYNQFIEAGKEKKVALTAIMRKLLVMANALLRGNRMWTETRP